MTELIEIRVPDVGDFDEVEIIEVLVAVGDSVDVNQDIITLESDKAAMEIPSPTAGVLKELKVAVGDKVKQGDLIAIAEVSSANAPQETVVEKPAPTVESKPAEPAAIPTTSGLVEIKVPDIGDFDEVEIIEVLVAVGDSVDANQDIITLESDKAAMEIPSPVAGVIKELKVAIGEKVKQGDVIAIAESASSAPVVEMPVAEVSSGKATAAAIVAQAMSKQAQSAAPEPELAPFAPDSKSAIKQAHASPSVRQFARELGVILSQVGDQALKAVLPKKMYKTLLSKKSMRPLWQRAAVLFPLFLWSILKNLVR